MAGGECDLPSSAVPVAEATLSREFLNCVECHYLQAMDPAGESMRLDGHSDTVGLTGLEHGQVYGHARVNASNCPAPA